MVKTSGNKEIKIKVMDKAGNESETINYVKIEFLVDTVEIGDYVEIDMRIMEEKCNSTKFKWNVWRI